MSAPPSLLNGSVHKSSGPSSVPRYAELPELGSLGIRHSRGILPAGLGTLSFIGEEQMLRARELFTVGSTFSLNLPLDAFDPPLFERSRLAHRLLEASRNEAEDVFDAFNPQASSQIDGLLHVRAREHGYYDGSLTLQEAQRHLGMENWATRGIVGRGVLLDLTGIAPDPRSGAAITPADLSRVAQEQGVRLLRGDILLLRTGWAASHLADQGGTPVASWTGLEASAAMAEYLWDLGIAAVGSDNPAVENAPGDPAVGSLHRRLIPALGMPMLELLELEQLAHFAREHHRWEFLFVSVPLHARGAASSPANALALL